MFQIQRLPDAFDAVVVGSGATGGWAAKKLTEAGLKVVLLEAGKTITPKDFTEHRQPWELEYLGMNPTLHKDRPVQSKCYACTEWNYKWFVNDNENPYTQAKPFSWIRQRVLGGRSNSWGRQSYRMGPLNFKAASHDGYGNDWPITYEELVPYYEEVENYVGISGQDEPGLDGFLPSSKFIPPMKLTCGEEQMRAALGKKMGRVLTIGRVAILTKNHNGRAACHYCGPCERGCTTRSYFNSTYTTLVDAQKTGNLTLFTDAVAARITKTPEGKARGVEYVDANSRQVREVRGKVILLCASTLESTRLLLNSGMANSSGALGKYLMDHIYEGGAAGELTGLPAKPWTGMQQRRPNGIYIPRYRNVQKGDESLGFLRGYGYQGGSSPSFDFGAPGFGKSFKEAVHKGATWRTSLAAWGECLARPENRVEIDPDRKDAYGIPVLKINMAWGGNELKMWQKSREDAAEMLEASGHKNVRLTGRPSVPGHCIHEIGTARMGSDSKTSVLNKYNQAWDVDNVYVTDGAAWVSSGCQNPTLTMMAITVRACDYIIREHGKTVAV